MLKKFLIFLALAFSLMGFAEKTGAAAQKHIVFDDSVIVLRGVVDDQSVARVSAAILEAPGKEVYLYLSSPGGNITAGLQLIDVIKNSGKTVKCVAGYAASMAFAILQACQERYVMDHSVIMQHVASYSMNGNEPNNWKMAHFIHDMVRKLEEAQAARLGLTYEQFHEKVRDDWWMLGDTAVKERAADDVVTASCTPSLTKKRTKQKVQEFIWVHIYEWSGCPLIEGPISVEDAPPEMLKK